MSRANIPDFAFTTGPKPDWESDIDYGDLLRTVSKSCVVLQSLRQSRERWLSDTFPRFSFKTRGKNHDPQPPPYVPYTRGKCDLRIGPHIFPDTTIYEMHYKSNQPPAASAHPTHAPQPSTSNWQAKGNVGYGVTSYAASASIAPTQPTSPGKKTTTISTASTFDNTSQALITKVNEAAANNPTLASLLRQAAEGSATSEQLNTLGILIQQLASTPESSSTVLPLAPPPAPPVSSPQKQQKQQKQQQPAAAAPPPPAQDFDLVFEFRERPQERWLFPRVPAVLKRDENGQDGHCDALIDFQLPFDTSGIAWLSANKPTEDTADKSATRKKKQQEQQREAVSLRLKQPPPEVWDTLNRWTGDEAKRKENQKILDKSKQPERVFLAHTLPQGDLLVALQAASQPPYQMKTLKPVNTKARSRRRPPPKPKDDAPNDGTESATGTTPASKKRRTSQAEKKATSVPIHCFHCKKTDVPLIQGGRYCRPCVEAGYATQATSVVSTPIPPPAIVPTATTADSNIPEVPTNNP